MSYYVHSFAVTLNGDGPVPIQLTEGSRVVGVYGPEHGAGHATARLLVLSATGCPPHELRERWFVAAKLGSAIDTKARPEQFQLVGVVHASRPGGVSLPWVIMEVDEWAR